MTNVVILPIPSEGDRPTSWIARATLVSSTVVPIFGFFAVSAVLPQIETSFAGEAGAALMTSLIPGVTSIAFAASAPLVGWLIDRRGYKLIYFLSLILFAAAGLSTGFMPNLYWILAMRAVTGVAIAGVLNAGLSGIGMMPDKDRPGLFGVQAFVAGTAAIPLFPLTGLLADHLGWRWVFSLYLIAVPFIFLCPRHPMRGFRKAVLFRPS